MVTAALLASAACARGGGATPATAVHEIVVSRLPDPVDASSFVDVTGDLLVPKSDHECTPESLDEARRRYERQLQLFQDDDYERVRWELERAYALCANPKILYNLGLIERQLGDLPRAYVLLEAYLARVAAPPERVAEVRKEMAEIEARLGWIAVECGPGVDHVVVDYRDLATLGACPFRRRMRVALGNHRVQSRAMETFTVNAGATLGLSFVRRPVGSR